jgi:hypothetical protein
LQNKKNVIQYKYQTVPPLIGRDSVENSQEVQGQWHIRFLMIA